MRERQRTTILAATPEDSRPARCLRSARPNRAAERHSTQAAPSMTRTATNSRSRPRDESLRGSGFSLPIARRAYDDLQVDATEYPACRRRSLLSLVVVALRYRTRLVCWRCHRRDVRSSCCDQRLAFSVFDVHATTCVLRFWCDSSNSMACLPRPFAPVVAHMFVCSGHLVFRTNWHRRRLSHVDRCRDHSTLQIRRHSRTIHHFLRQNRLNFDVVIANQLRGVAIALERSGLLAIRTTAPSGNQMTTRSPLDKLTSLAD